MEHRTVDLLISVDFAHSSYIELFRVLESATHAINFENSAIFSKMQSKQIALIYITMIFISGWYVQGAYSNPVFARKVEKLLNNNEQFNDKLRSITRSPHHTQVQSSYLQSLR